MVDGVATWPATKEPTVFELTEQNVGQMKFMRKLAGLCAQKSIYAADEATARELNVPFFETRWVDGMIVEGAATVSKRSAKSTTADIEEVTNG